MLAVPDVDAVNVLVQVAVPAVVPVVRLQVVKAPVTPVTPSVSVPVGVGVLTVPPAVSVTVAVHIDPWLIRRGEGAQVTPVVVVRGLTVTIAAALCGLAL